MYYFFIVDKIASRAGLIRFVGQPAGRSLETPEVKDSLTLFSSFPCDIFVTYQCHLIPMHLITAT